MSRAEMSRCVRYDECVTPGGRISAANECAVGERRDVLSGLVLLAACTFLTRAAASWIQSDEDVNDAERVDADGGMDAETSVLFSAEPISAVNVKCGDPRDGLRVTVDSWLLERAAGVVVTEAVGAVGAEIGAIFVKGGGTTVESSVFPSNVSRSMRSTKAVLYFFHSLMRPDAI